MAQQRSPVIIDSDLDSLWDPADLLEEEQEHEQQQAEQPLTPSLSPGSLSPLPPLTPEPETEPADAEDLLMDAIALLTLPRSRLDQPRRPSEAGADAGASARKIATTETSLAAFMPRVRAKARAVGGFIVLSRSGRLSPPELVRAQTTPH